MGVYWWQIIALALVASVGPWVVSPALAQPAAKAPAPVQAAYPAEEERSTPSEDEIAPDTDVAPPPLAEMLSGQAKLDYEGARVSFGKGDFARALVQFQSAYQTSGDPRLLWNAAACEAKQFHYGRAIALVESYLDSGSPLVTARDRERAQAFIDAAKKMTVVLEIKSNVHGAEIYLDGELIGTTPLAPDVRVDLGRHEVVAKLDGYHDFRDRVVITPTNRTVEAPLEPIVRQGQLVVLASVGDSIELDGQVVGASTWRGALPVGAHRLRVSAPERVPFETSLDIVEDETRTINVNLEPEARRKLPTWAWIAGGVALAAGATTATYFIARPSEETPPSGSIATVDLPWSR